MSIVEFIKNLFGKGKSEEAVVLNTAKDLAEEQKVINELYARDGLTEEVLNRQINVNKKRNELDIPDETLLINGWSQ